MSSEYTPDKWVVVEVHTKDGEILYKVLGSWYGGYAGSDEWRFSSGITSVVHHDKHYDIQSYSVCSDGRTGYLLTRTQIKGVYLQNTYDGSKLVSCVIMDTNEDF